MIERWPADRERGAGLWVARALTAIGHNGTVEDQLVRLMVWTAAAVRFDKSRHSLLYRPIDILEEGTAWCDQHCLVWMHYAHEILGVDTRILTLRHSDGKNGHTVAEASYYGTWHLFDVAADHQAVYRGGDGRALSYDEIVQMPYIVEAENHWWRGADGVGKVGFYRVGGLVDRTPRAAP